MRHSLIIIAALLCVSCMGVPQGITVVDHVEPSKYLGTWYEIARLDHRFERGLEKVTANYSMREDGGIQVINGGFNIKEQKWEQAVGKAYFVDEPHADKTYSGKLKVSFFGPFYGAYNIIELDKPDYEYVMVCGPDRSYFWILSRKPVLAEPIKQKLVAKAKELGFKADDFIYVNQ